MTELEKAGMQYSHNHTDEDESGVSIRLRESFISGAEWQSKQSPWISVEERLPDNQDIVLVKTDNGCFLTAYLHGKKSGFITYGEDAYKELGEVTHWMTIPE